MSFCLGSRNPHLSSRDTYTYTITLADHAAFA